MTLTTQTTLGLLALAALTGWYLGGALGAGVVAGALAGATVAGSALALQRKIAVSKPQFLLHAVLGGFLLKAFVMLVTTLLVHYVPALSRALDSVSYLVAFAVTAVLVLVPATLDTLGSLGGRAGARPSAKAGAPTTVSRSGGAT